MSLSPKLDKGKIERLGESPHEYDITRTSFKLRTMS
jgi:hypothetical protein